MSSLDRIPREVWLEVFRLLSRDVLANISSSYRLFHRMIRPLLFAHFNFHLGAPMDHDSLVDTAELDRYLDRLDFWCSHEIAPLIHSCNITHGRPAAQITACSETLLATFFERLPRFTSLQRLYVRDIPFTETTVAILCRLPALDLLDIEACHVAPGAYPSLALPISTFSCSGFPPASGIWIRLFHPDHLRELDWIDYPSPLAEAIENLPVFHHVNKVRISGWGDLPDMGQTMVFLSKFPAIEVLALRRCGPLVNGAGAQASNLLPLLKDYSGRCHTLSVFLPLPTLTCLTVYSCSPRDFMVQLQGIRTPNKITSLTVSFATSHPSVDSFDNDALYALCGSFPWLTELRISINHGELEPDVNSGVKKFLETLADDPALPPALKCLSLSWDFEFVLEEFDESPVDQLPNFPVLRDALVARCPDLTSIWIDGNDALFQWRKSLDGTVVEATTDDPDDMEAMRDGFISFWETR
ncbi:hypothetical protein FB451DRAFT_1238243 [Mycena latifolia]|nr:hypothetical protein FB451DRAFT_1238243 [Mycena latifolia]